MHNIYFEEAANLLTAPYLYILDGMAAGLGKFGIGKDKYYSAPAALGKIDQLLLMKKMQEEKTKDIANKVFHGLLLLSTAIHFYGTGSIAYGAGVFLIAGSALLIAFIAGAILYTQT